MSRTHSRANRRTRQRRSRAPVILLASGLGAAVIVVLALVLTSSGGGPSNSDPSVSAGSASLAGVQVVRPSVDLGRQPLDTPVTHSFVVKNTNTRTVQFGDPAIEVLDGC